MSPRDVWPHEAASFTPWLLANADALGEVLGMDELVLSGAEHAVGGFSLDLIGVDQSTGETVIIENQLEPTNHGHLGQLLTYAGGTDPTNVVWLATRFREEHRAALEWLNARTDEYSRFFGVEVGAVRIGESAPAPRFTVVVQPNDWGKQVRSGVKAEASGGERAALYREFWNRFLERVAEERPTWTRSRKGAPQNWQPLPAGMTGVSYTCVFTRGQQLTSELFFSDPNPDINDSRLAAALAAKQEMEHAYGAPLSFEPLEGKKGCRIADRRDGDIDRADEWDQYIAWFLDSQTKLRQAVAAIGGFAEAT